MDRPWEEQEGTTPREEDEVIEASTGQEETPENAWLGAFDGTDPASVSPSTDAEPSKDAVAPAEATDLPEASPWVDETVEDTGDDAHDDAPDEDVPADAVAVEEAEPEETPRAAPPTRRTKDAATRGIPGAVEPAAAVDDPNGYRWFAVRVQSNKEDSVKRNMERKIELRGLGRKIAQVIVPTEKVAEIKNGKKRTRQVKTYPGYVLVEMLMDDETWAFVRETPGVGDFVGGGSGNHQKPFPLREDEVRKIFGLDAPGEEPMKIKIDFGIGDKVKIKEGPFENFDGVVEELNEQKGLVRVVVTIFGRATPVELQYWQVETV